jgi:hypothetical protein
MGNDALVAYQIVAEPQEGERHERPSHVKKNRSFPYEMASVLKLEVGIVFIMEEGACQVDAIDRQPRILDGVMTGPNSNA